MTVPSRIELPEAPAAERERLDEGGVACWESVLVIDSYAADAPDEYPVFFDRRVYQGSDGRIYPVPFVDGIAAEKAPRAWRAIHLENAWVRLVLLPELGGRIHIGYDKTRDYDFFYRNNVIKPALVGLGGPWISGGVEFNWPQHHRPATYLPVETWIEHEPGGAVTVWHSDLDPLQRMRGTHGIRLRPDSAVVEVIGRLHNRTERAQTFLWWANVAAAVHEQYQSFFPTDVHYVADHARRAVSAFPAADRPYYGVDYPALAEAREGADRLDFYSNIPVPSSYMITDTADSFFGGYDHRAQAGFVHWADRTIAPGKKQWTWGDGPIGRAWDDQLTDGDGPYIELMAGVFTDNQPDFSYLAPGETREFSQFWYPIQDVGVVHQATLEAALAVDVAAGGRVTVGVAVPAEVAGELVVEGVGDGCRVHRPVHAAPGSPDIVELTLEGIASRDELIVTLVADGRELVRWEAHPGETAEPWLATVPPEPAEITSVDEALLTAQHLTQYRHPTRSAAPYLQRVLELDPADSRAHLALAERAYAAGDYAEALAHLDAASARITRRNLNPRTGELPYLRGLVLARLGRDRDAADAFAKSAWDGGFALAGHLGAARALLRLGALVEAEQHARTAFRTDERSAEARAALVLVLGRLGRGTEADELLAAGRALDPLDPLLAALDGELEVVDPRTPLAMAFELAGFGETEAALVLAQQASDAGPSEFGNPGPVAHLLRAELLRRAGRADEARFATRAAETAERRYAFPAGLDELDVLRAAISDAEATGESAALPLGLLGSLLLGDRRPAEAREALDAAVAAGSDDPVVWRNAAIATVNAGGDPERADELLARALELAGPVPRLAYERDQLARLRGVGSAERLAALEASGADLFARHDLAIATLGLWLDAGRADEALEVLTTRVFQPFEGGEGQAIAAFDRAVIAVAERLSASDPASAAALLDGAITPPRNLGEGRHPAAPVARLLVAAGDAYAAAGDLDSARERWRAARDGAGALDVAPRPARLDDEWVGIARLRLGESADAVWAALEETAVELEKAPAAPDFFATSLPELLLFSVDDGAGRRALVGALRDAAARGRARG